MSVAYFVVVNAEDPGFDTFVDGKLFTKHLQAINKLARSNELQEFDEFANQDLSEFGVPTEETVWYEAGVGIDWVSKMLAILRNAPDAVADNEAVVEDLEDYLRVFRMAESRGLKWHLELDF